MLDEVTELAGWRSPGQAVVSLTAKTTCVDEGSGWTGAGAAQDGERDCGALHLCCGRLNGAVREQQVGPTGWCLQPKPQDARPGAGLTKKASDAGPEGMGSGKRESVGRHSEPHRAKQAVCRGTGSRLGGAAGLANQHGRVCSTDAAGSWAAQLGDAAGRCGWATRRDMGGWC